MATGTQTTDCARTAAASTRTATRTNRGRRGATGIAYALILGLISIGVIGTVDRVGDAVATILEEADQAIQRDPVISGRDDPQEDDPEEEETPDPGTVSLALLDATGTGEADGSGLDVDGGGATPSTRVDGAARTFLLRSTGTAPASIIDVRLTDTTDFRVTGDTCSGATLAATGDECQLTITPSATANGPLTASMLQIEF